jgi:parvulin-like peptidyl-prolyl isomerase
VRAITFVLIASVCLLVLFGVVGRCPATEETAAAESTATDASDPILAKVQDHPIRQSDVDLLYAQFGLTPKDVPLEKAVEELIRRESIRQYILASDVKVEPAELEARWEQFKQQVADAGMTLEEVFERYRLDEERYKEVLSIELALNKLAEARITQAELDSLEEQVRASHILIQVPKGASATEWQQAEQMIRFIRKEIEDGQSFEDCAKAYSACNSKSKGGDLGFFPRKGVMDDTFAAAAYALKVGEISEPVKTQFGYHLIKVTDRSTEPSKQQLIAGKRVQIVREILETTKVERFYEKESADEDKPSEPSDDEPSQPDDNSSTQDQ